MLAGAGMLLGVASAIYYAVQPEVQPPMFNPAPNPFGNGIYANGIVQSDQENGVNIPIYTEVAATVREIAVKEGQSVRRGDILLVLDGSVQRATAEQLQAQAEAARASLAELRAQPRPESLAVWSAQVEAAAATLKLNQDTFAKLQGASELGPDLVSKDQLDTAANAVRVAAANLAVARRQYDLVKAGAWKYDIDSAVHQLAALDKAYRAAAEQLEKYTVRAPVDGRVLSIQTAVGSYASVQGTYDVILGGNTPLIIMGGGSGDTLSVRCYIDEILIHKLRLQTGTPARLYVRGTDVSIPLEFVRVQPYVSPKIQLSNERAERVDLRVLPVIFRLVKPPQLQLYPGQLVDVYIAGVDDTPVAASRSLAAPAAGAAPPAAGRRQ
jgi:HlyD family secretion protein